MLPVNSCLWSCSVTLPDRNDRQQRFAPKFLRPANHQSLFSPHLPRNLQLQQTWQKFVHYQFLGHDSFFFQSSCTLQVPVQRQFFLRVNDKSESDKPINARSVNDEKYNFGLFTSSRSAIQYNTSGVYILLENLQN